ncbi:response regulator [Desulfovibrionales bacterium]
MSTQILKKDPSSLYDQIVRHYVTNQLGVFLLVTNDDMFIKTARGALRTLGLNYDSLSVTNISADIGKKCKDILSANPRLLLIIESKIHGRSNVFDFKIFKQTFGDALKIICITPEVSEDHVAFIAENEADSIIVKPISINNIIQKIAFTIKPINNFYNEIEKIKHLITVRQFDEANRRIDLLLQQKPNSSICLILKGDISKTLQEYEEAEFFYMQAAKESKLNLKPLQRLVDLYTETSNAEHSLKYLLLMDKISPLNHNRKIDIGTLYSRDGEAKTAEKYYQEAINIVESQANDLLASTLMDIGIKLREHNPEQAMHFMEKAIATKGENITREDLWMVNEMGMSLRKEGNWQGAIQAYQRALRLIPNESGLHYNIGMAYAQGKEYYKAICEFDKAISIAPEILRESPFIPYNIGQVYYQMNRYPEVDQYMKMALVLDPEFERAKVMLGKISIK